MGMHHSSCLARVLPAPLLFVLLIISEHRKV